MAAIGRRSGTGVGRAGPRGLLGAGRGGSRGHSGRVGWRRWSGEEEEEKEEERWGEGRRAAASRPGRAVSGRAVARARRAGPAVLRRRFVAAAFFLLPLYFWRCLS